MGYFMNKHQLGYVYNPGSPQAVECGCTCSIIDNNRGNGYMNIPGLFLLDKDCPVHGYKMMETIAKRKITF